MASTISRSSLEVMLELIQKREELPKDAPPALPARPTSRGRLPSSRRSLPLNLRARSLTPEALSKGSEDRGHKFLVPESWNFESDKFTKLDHLEELNCVNEGLGEAAYMDLALDDKFGNKENVLEKIVELGDARCLTLQHIVGVQKYFRGVQARRHYEELKKEVTGLQSFIRGERARHEFGLILKRWKAAFILQKYARGWLARTMFVHQMREIVHLQSVVRGWLARKQLTILKDLKNSKLIQAYVHIHSDKITQEVKDSNKELVWVHHSVVKELEMRVQKAEASLKQKEDEHAVFRLQIMQYEAKMKSTKETWQRKQISTQDPNEHSLVHQSIELELQRLRLETETAVRRKEEVNAKLRQQLQQYEMRWSEYEVRMKSMEEMWQRQMTSLQLSLAAARKSLVTDALVSPPVKPVTSPTVKPVTSPTCHSFNSESTVSTEACSPECALAKHLRVSSLGVGGNPNSKQLDVGLLAKEFEQRKRVFEEDSAGLLIAAKFHEPNTKVDPYEELRKLKIQFASWEKDYKVRLREAKSAIRKLGNARSEKSRTLWWCRRSS